MTLEPFPCRDATQFLAASSSESQHFHQQAPRQILDLEAYIAGSANWKLSLAGSPKSMKRLLNP